MKLLKLFRSNPMQKQAMNLFPDARSEFQAQADTRQRLLDQLGPDGLTQLVKKRAAL